MNKESIEKNVDVNETMNTNMVVNATQNIEKNHTKIALKTAKIIKGEKNVDVKIPIDTQNPKDLIVPVIINGYRWEIKRGEKVSVPAPVAKILEESRYI